MFLMPCLVGFKAPGLTFYFTGAEENNSMMQSCADVRLQEMDVNCAESNSVVQSVCVAGDFSIDTGDNQGEEVDWYIKGLTEVLKQVGSDVNIEEHSVTMTTDMGHQGVSSSPRLPFTVEPAKIRHKAPVRGVDWLVFKVYEGGK